MAREQVRVFTPTQLRALRGESDSRICLSIKGVVYDVSQSRHLYGPDGPYQCFAGKEVSRALALFSLAEEDCNGDLSGLDEDQLSHLDEWIAKFNRQYPIVGRIMDSFWHRLFKSFF